MIVFFYHVAPHVTVSSDQSVIPYPDTMSATKWKIKIKWLWGDNLFIFITFWKTWGSGSDINHIGNRKRIVVIETINPCIHFMSGKMFVIYANVMLNLRMWLQTCANSKVKLLNGLHLRLKRAPQNGLPVPICWSTITIGKNGQRHDS